MLGAFGRKFLLRVQPFHGRAFERAPAVGELAHGGLVLGLRTVRFRGQFTHFHAEPFELRRHAVAGRGGMVPNLLQRAEGR